jgi:chromosome partitioning protein
MMAGLPPDFAGADMAARRRITVINEKGGSTKTTTAVNLAGALVAKGKKVRVIDLDPQDGSATIWLSPTESVGSGVMRVFDEECGIDDVTSETKVPGLYIVPSYSSMSVVRYSPDYPVVDVQLADALDESEADIDYDIIDSPPTKDRLARAALNAAGEIVVPIQPSKLDTVGTAELLRLMATVRKHRNPDLRIAAVVASRVKAAGYDTKFVENLQRQFGATPVLVVSDSVRAREAVEAGTPVAQYDPESRNGKEFAALAAVWEPDTKEDAA